MNLKILNFIQLIREYFWGKSIKYVSSKGNNTIISQYNTFTKISATTPA